MRLVIQIPAHNEEQSLSQTLNALPRHVEGFDSVKWLVVDDGSTDATIEVAKAGGADEVASVFPHRGLAEAFRIASRLSLSMDADVIVNTDADNQYCADDIAKLVEPIVRGRADLVVGSRPVWRTFSGLKRWLQIVGSFTISRMAGVRIPDCTSGFRAMSAETAMKLKVRSRYTYTLETLLLAGFLNLRVISVPIRTNPVSRPSRLVKSVPGYLFHAAKVVMDHFLFYRFAELLVCFLGSIALTVSAAIAFQNSKSSPILQTLAEGLTIGLCFLFFASLCVKFGRESPVTGSRKLLRRRSLENRNDESTPTDFRVRNLDSTPIERG